jgi:hypothetical protein
MKPILILVIVSIIILSGCGSECTEPGVYQCQSMATQSYCPGINEGDTQDIFYTTLSEPLCMTKVDEDVLQDSGCIVDCSTEISPSGSGSINSVSVCELQCSDILRCVYTVETECEGV